MPHSSPRPHPRVLTLTADGDDYTTCFDAALRRQGLEVQKAEWSGRWLYAEVHRGDVVLLHWPSFLYYCPGAPLRTWVGLLRFIVLLLLLRARGARIAWTAHNLYPHDGHRAELAHRIARRVVVALASIVGVHGPGSAALVQREFAVAPARLVTLEHGNWVGFYPNSVSGADARARLGVPQSAFVFLFIGLCKPYKDLEHLVRSFRALGDDSLLWIVGRFDARDYYGEVSQAAAGAPPGRIAIRDEFVERDDMQLYLNAADVVVLPYREVLTSGAAMLALSFGRPVVAPRLGTLAELVGDDSGALYDPDRDAALTAAMRAVRGRRFDSGQLIARAQKYSWDRSARAFAARVASAGATPHARGFDQP